MRPCFKPHKHKTEGIHNLQREYRSFSTMKDYWSFMVRNRDELLAVCRVESERPWIEWMLDSVSDKQKYQQLLRRYEDGFSVLSQRRARVRNALVHGNPVETLALRSVATLASYYSDYALKAALTAFIEGRPLVDVLDDHLAQVRVTEDAASIAEYWEAQ